MDLFGRLDQHLKTIEGSFSVRVVPRGNELVVTGNELDVERVAAVFRHLRDVLRQSGAVSAQDVRYAVRMVKEGEGAGPSGAGDDALLITSRGRAVRPKTVGQRTYVEAVKDHGIVFGIGPAGTGKTYLAVAMAIAAYRTRSVERIMLTRPAVEAGERLGFLPGDLQEKVNPYLRPLYDALYDFLGAETVEKYMGRGIIEIAPLAYMRGRTLDESFVILDEAQNTTSEQMKMFLTRLGLGSRAVITGDITQVDLPRGTRSGLDEVREVLHGVPGIAFIYLTERDVVRHELVSRVIKAYERFEHERAAARNAPPEGAPRAGGA